MITEEETRFEALLDYLKRSRGFNFTGYKRSTVMRRVLKRMQMVDLHDFTEYVDYLEVHPEEFTQLFNTILINVTAFFRDEPAWDFLAKEIIPQILAGKHAGDPIRVWSAGCSSGQETYSVAMLLAEALGPEAFRQRVKIYATDVDEEAAQARQATYSDQEMETVPAPLREKYFQRADNRSVFRADLRRSIIFGRIDLVQDAPISHLDLLVCRNTLMYFNAETQAKVLNRLHFALNDTGFLFLGQAEMLLTHTNLFKPANLGHRVFARTPQKDLPGRPLVINRDGDDEANIQHRGRNRLGELSFDAVPIAQVVVDGDGRLAMINTRARALFGLSMRDVGRLLQDLVLSFRPLEIRSLIEQAYAEGRAVEVKNVERRSIEGEAQWLEVRVTPLQDDGGSASGVSITYEDVTRYRHQQDELRRSSQAMETAYEELQSVREELETTNEELQCANEELETTNEELQSGNEELETTNEELQSTNQELDTINQELNQRSGELQDLNTFLQAILGSLRVAVVVVDPQLTVLTWNRRAEDLWGLRSDEVQGQSLLGLDMGLPVEKLPLRAFLTSKTGAERVELEAVNRRGKPFWCEVTSTRFVGLDGERQGLVLLMEDVSERKRADQSLHDALIYAQGIVETVRQPLVVLDGNLRVKTANGGFYRNFQTKKEETEGFLIYELGNHQWDIPALRSLLEEILPKNEVCEGFEVEHRFPIIGRKKMLLNARQMDQEGKKVQLILLAIEDVTDCSDLSDEASEPNGPTLGA